MNRVHSLRSFLRKCSGFLTLAIVTLLVHRAQAQVTLPWYEPFAYPTGQYLGTNDSATVWSIGATTGLGSPSVYPIDNLSYSGLQTSTNSSGLIMGLQGKSRNRGVILSGVSSNIYTSFLLNVQTLPTADSMFVALSTVASGTGPGSAATGIWITPSGQLKVSVDTSASDAGGTAALTTNVTHFVVMSYTNKTLSVWLDPGANTFSNAETALPPVSTSTVNPSGKATTTMASLWIMHDSSKFTNFIAELDEFRAGSTWASVTPPGTAATATAIKFTSQPGYAGVGASIGTVTAQIVDQYGQPFAKSGTAISLSLSGSGTLGGTTTQTTDGTGKATFSGVSVSAPGIDQLVAGGSGLTAGNSDYFSVLSANGGGGSTPVVSQAVKTSTGFIIRGNNGQANQSFKVLASSSLSTPRSAWSPVGTNTFAADGSFNCTNTLSGNQRYYAIAYTSTGGGTLTVPGFAMMGFVNSNNITGGKGGPTVTVTNYSDLTNYCLYPAPLTIRVLGSITNGNAGKVSNDYCYVTSEGGSDNKTIIGAGNNATLVGVDLRPHATNIIIRNLFFIVPPATNDAITLDGGKDGTNQYTWVDHCDFFNAQDGSCDITKGADYVTVSWCRYHYTTGGAGGNPAPWHRLADLIGASDSDTGVNFHVTFHHDWYDTNCMERMPSVRFGHVHIFNNYYACPGNDYCIRTRLDAQILVENTYFNQVNDPFEYFINQADTVLGMMKQTGNLAVNCTSNYNYILLTDTNHLDPTSTPPQAANTLKTSDAVSIVYYPNSTSGNTATITNVLDVTGLGNDTLGSDLNPPPYTYVPFMDPVASVPGIVTNFAGAGVILPLP